MKVGAAFSDYIYTEKPSLLKSKRNYDSDEPVRIRALLLPIILIISLVILFIRLFYLQVVNGQEYRLLSDTNRTRTTTIYAPRGIIFDTNGKPLVFNTPGFRKFVNNKAELLDANTGIELLAQGDKQVQIDSLRQYPFRDSLAHVLGYIGQISTNELSLPQYASYSVGDEVGKMGIEQQYEQLLRGTNGQKLVEVNAEGKPVRTLGQTDPIPGRNITITIDSDLQQTTYDAMQAIPKGAAIVSRPNGEILSLVSKPSFDPNLFTLGTHYIPASSSAYQSVSNVLLDSQNQPLLDRAISGQYPPGSTFKLLVAAAGLEDKKIDANYTVDDTGILKVGDFSFTNWYYTQYGKTEGTINVIRAITRSNDIFFYKLGNLLGVDAISQEAAKFGVGKKLGIDLAGEQAGLLPTKEWKEKTIHEPWYLGDDYHYGIGQGYLLTTPLQVNAWTQAIANSGTLYQPHLLKTSKPVIENSNFLDPTNVDIIRQGMIGVCQPGGVAYPFFNFKVKNPSLVIDGKNFIQTAEATQSANPDSKNYRSVTIACKTGTAQQGGDSSLAHAWITIYAPAYNPQIVVTVLAESSGEGSDVAAPVAKKILESYFTNLK